MTLGRIGERATNDNVMVGTVLCEDGSPHITVLRRHEIEPGWWHRRNNYTYDTWDDYDRAEYTIVSHPLGAPGERATNNNVTTGTVVEIDSQYAPVYPTWRVGTPRLERGWWQYSTDPRSAQREWDDYDQNHYTIISQPDGLTVATDTSSQTTPQETTAMLPTTLGAPGERATYDNVTTGTVVQRHGVAQTYTLARPGRPGRWINNFGRLNDLENYDYRIVSQPESVEPHGNLGASGDIATNDNVMPGTIIRYTHRHNRATGEAQPAMTGEHRLTRQEGAFWLCAHVSGDDGLGGLVYLNDPHVTIVSHPEPPQVAEQAAGPTVEQLQADFKVFAERLLDEARTRGWCSEYDTFVRHTNRDTTYLKLIPCRRNVHVSFRLRIDDSNGLTDDQIREAVRQHANGNLIRGEVLVRTVGDETDDQADDQ